MLVLARKKNESIIVTAENGESITIVVKNIGRGVVRVGIDAPKDTLVVREELTTRVRSKSGAREEP
ncbi:MAG: carbon storage regulator [Planctomycetia bacterium]|nr:carbon storage regulator [Planctomycetia bacterium]